METSISKLWLELMSNASSSRTSKISVITSGNCQWLKSQESDHVYAKSYRHNIMRFKEIELIREEVFEAERVDEEGRKLWDRNERSL
jgi:hypothetical protein